MKIPPKLCWLLGHKPINKVLAYDNGNWRTFNAICKRCNCKMFGKEEIGEHSQELITSWIKI